MITKQENLGKFPLSPYELGAEAAVAANVILETIYTTTDGQSSFPYQEVEMTTPEAKDGKLVRHPGFVRGFHHGREQLVMGGEA